MLEEVMYYACAIISFTVALTGHEVAHGYAAYKLGDPTAKRAGRLSLNPLKHIDPFGTVILPLMLMVLHMPIFGYAKPVPYNPSYFKDPRKGDAITGFAGPAANLVMAVLAALLAHVVFGLAPHILQSQAGYFLMLLLATFTLVNLYLMFFNLIPIPPLDGSKVLFALLPEGAYYTLMRYERYGMALLLLLVWFDVGSSALSTAIYAVYTWMMRLFF